MQYIGSGNMKVLVNYVRHSRNQHNTDVAYPQHFMSLSEQNHIQIVFNESRLSAWLVDAAIRLNMTRLSGKRLPFLSRIIYFFSRHTFLFPWQLREIDVILTFWFFPIVLSKRKIPIFFPSGFSSNETVGAQTDAERAPELAQLEKWFSRADLIAFPAQSRIDHFNSLNSDYQDKIVFLPFLLPSVFPVDASFVNAKFEDPQVISILFVARDGNLKGLSNLCQALDMIAREDTQIAKRLSVTIVSETRADRIKGIEMRQFASLSHPEVLALMRAAHVFCLPTQRDAFGLVFLEAMASGCAIIADNRDPRPEILGQGDCGILTDTSPLALAAAIKKIVKDLAAAKALALRALNRFNAVYDFRIVRQQYIDQLVAIDNRKSSRT